MDCFKLVFIYAPLNMLNNHSYIPLLILSELKVLVRLEPSCRAVFFQNLFSLCFWMSFRETKAKKEEEKIAQFHQ